MTTLTHIECSRCGTSYDPAAARNRCACGGPLLARYDLEAARTGWSRDWIKNAPATMWRYTPVLPARKPSSIVSLGEGMTPLIHARRLGERLGLDDLRIKDEGPNPTGSVKARGISCAVSMAVELGMRRVAVRSAGNAGGALAAYAAAAGIETRVFAPRDLPPANYLECRAYGAELTLADEPADLPEGWFDLSALQEPYRVEGAKTIGYEIAEQLGWALPDAVLVPTGAGIGLIGLWKAFDELERLGWTASARPRMIAVRAQNAWTLAAHLRTPAPLDPLALAALSQSGGTSIEVADREIIAAGLELAALEGILAAPEGAAAIAALPKLLTAGLLKPGERVVACNTGWGLKHPQAYWTRFPKAGAGERDKLGGLITPR